MAGERILYVCHDPALLLLRERLLLKKGFQVVTVLGTDGLTALSQVDEFDFVLIGDEGSLAERQGALLWLKEEWPRTHVIALARGVEHLPGSDYQVSTTASQDWIDALADCIKRCRTSA
jgi:hypothetical protein